ncbi:MAG: beta-eliminating lyase-related protein [Rhodobacteraceae bacterium]|nr:beta-eliminating lyase-related protein [Paracoccaceae bacterium]
MFFASDNAGPAHPSVIDAVVAANTGYAAAYGSDPHMETLRTRLRTLFEAPDAAVYLVATGTAANALALATLGQPWQTIFCTPVAHIFEDECNAPEFFSGGTKLTQIAGSDKMDPATLAAVVATQEMRGVHSPQRGPLSLTQATEKGQVYTCDELAALTSVARAHDLPVHMDGARFANALVKLGCSAAEMTWKAGIDAVSFGGTKNGLMGAEAVIFFDPAHAWEFELRRKRAAHLFSKHRYLSAQIAAYLENDLWLRLAADANARATRLAALLQRAGARLTAAPDANMVFAELPRATHAALKSGGAQYHLWSGTLEGDDPAAPLEARFVCDWSLPDAELARFAALLDTVAQPA